MAGHEQGAAILAALMAVAGCGVGAESPVHSSSQARPDQPPQRIVSLAPSLTETLFALGVGDRVVGVTRYCADPPEVEQLPKVGGYLDPNFEAIVALRPDLVVSIPSSDETARRLESLHLPVVSVDQHDVSGVTESISTLAEICGVPDRGEVLRAAVESRLRAVSERVAASDLPRVAVVVGHDIGGGAVRTVWAAGPDTFYDGVLEIAGGVNAVEGGLVRYPEFSREGLSVLDPDVVLDVIAGVEDRGLDLVSIRDGWRQLTELRAVREDRIRVLSGDVMVVPGPRLPEMVEAIARAIHPDLEWGAQ